MINPDRMYEDRLWRKACSLRRPHITPLCSKGISGQNRSCRTDRTGCHPPPPPSNGTGSDARPAGRLPRTNKAPGIHSCLTGVASAAAPAAAARHTLQIPMTFAQSFRVPTCLAPPRSLAGAGDEPPSHQEHETGDRDVEWPSPGRGDACRAGASGMRTARWNVGQEAGDSRTAL